MQRHTLIAGGWSEAHGSQRTRVRHAMLAGSLVAGDSRVAGVPARVTFGVARPATVEPTAFG
ncbi:MAG: hypothetical protein WCQ91_08830 [Planctomycetota bacterium]